MGPSLSLLTRTTSECLALECHPNSNPISKRLEPCHRGNVTSSHTQITHHINITSISHVSLPSTHLIHFSCCFCCYCGCRFGPPQTFQHLRYRIGSTMQHPTIKNEWFFPPGWGINHLKVSKSHPHQSCSFCQTFLGSFVAFWTEFPCPQNAMAPAAPAFPSKDLKSEPAEPDSHSLELEISGAPQTTCSAPGDLYPSHVAAVDAVDAVDAVKRMKRVILRVILPWSWIMDVCARVCVYVWWIKTYKDL